MSTSLPDLVMKFKVDLTNFSQGIAFAKGQVASFTKDGEDRWGNFNEKIKAAGQEMKTVGAHIAAMGAALSVATGLAVNSAGNFESSLMRAANVSGKTGDALAAMKDQLGTLAQELSGKTVYSANQCTDALYVLSEKGFITAKTTAEDLVPILNLATSTTGNLTVASELVTAGIRAFGMAASDTSRVADIFTKSILQAGGNTEEFQAALRVLGPVSRAAGVSLEQVSALLVKFDETGTPATMAAQALKKAFADLSALTATQVKTLSDLNLKVEDVNLKTHTFTDVLGALDKAGISSAQVLQIFGDRAGPVIAQLLSLDESGKKAYQSVDEFSKVLKGSAGTAAEIAANNLKSYNGQMALLKNSFDNLVLELGQTVLPAVKDVMGKVTEAVHGINEWAKANPELAKSLMTIAVAAGPAAIALGGILTAVGQFLVTVQMVRILTAVGGALGAFTAATQGTAGALAGMVALITGPAGTVLAIGALAVTVGIAIGKFIDLQNAMHKVNETGVTSATSVQNSYDKIATKLKDLYGTYAKSDAELYKSFAYLDLLIVKRKEYADEVQRDGKVTENELNQLTAQGRAILDVVNQIQTMGKAHKEAAGAVQEETQVQAQAVSVNQAFIDQMKMLGIAVSDTKTELKGSTDAVTALTYAANISAMSLQTTTSVFSQAMLTAATITKMLKDIGAKEYDIKINFKLQGAAELASVEQEMLRLQHQIQMEGASTAEQQKMQLKFDLEESLLALKIKSEAYKVAHEQLLLQIQAEIDQRQKQIEQDKEMIETEKKQRIDALNTELSARIQGEEEVYNQTLTGYEQIRALTVQLADVKLQNIDKVKAATLTEAQSAQTVVAANAAATQSYVERANAAQMAASYATGGGGGGGGVTSGVATFASWAEKEAANLPMGTMYKIAGFATGTDYVPETGVYRLHKGETVTPAGDAPYSGKMEITIVNQIDGGALNSLLAANPNTVINIIGQDIGRGGNTQKTIVNLMRKNLT